MAIEAKIQVRPGESMETEITLPLLRSVITAGVRISDMYDKPLSFTTLHDHIPDIAADCTYFQESQLSEDYVAQTIHAITGKAPRFTDDPFFEEVYLANLVHALQRNDIKSVDTLFTTINRKFITISNYREHVFSAMQTSSHGDLRSLDTLRSLAHEDHGFDEVEESDTDPFERTKTWLESPSTDPVHREIVLAKLRHEPDVDTRYSSTASNAATKSLYYYVEYGRFLESNEEYAEEDQNGHTSTKNADTIASLRIRLRDFLATHGGLECVFQYVQSLPISSHDKALPTMALLHFLGYYHPEETNIEFVLNEAVTIHAMTSGLTILLREALEGLQAQQTEATYQSFSTQLTTLHQLSFTKNGERISIPESYDDKLSLLYQKLHENPHLATRMKQPLQKALVERLMQTQEAQQLSFERMCQLLQSRMTPTQTPNSQMRDAILRSLVKVLDRHTYKQSGRRMSESSYHQRILQAALTPEQRLLIQSSEKLSRVYKFITTPDEHGNFPTIEDLEKTLHIHRRNVGHIAAILGFSPVEQVFEQNGKTLATQIIGMRLGLPMETILSPGNSKQIVQFIQKQIKSGKPITEIAAIANCTPELLCMVIGLKLVPPSSFIEENQSLLSSKNLYQMQRIFINALPEFEEYITLEWVKQVAEVYQLSIRRGENPDTVPQMGTTAVFNALDTRRRSIPVEASGRDRDILQVYLGLKRRFNNTVGQIADAAGVSQKVVVATLDRYGWNPLLRTDRTRIIAGKIIRIAKYLEKTEAAAWRNVSFEKLSEELAKRRIDMTPDELSSFWKNYQGSLLDSLPSREKPKLTEEQEAEIIRLSRRGVSQRNIAQQIGTTKRIIERVQRDAGL